MALDTPTSHKKERITFSTVNSQWTQAVASQSSKDIITYLFTLDNFFSRLAVTSMFNCDTDTHDTSSAICDNLTKMLYGPDEKLIEPSPFSTQDIVKHGFSPDRVAHFFAGGGVEMISEVSSIMAAKILSNRTKPTKH